MGDSGGAAGDGADGISFYLMDGCMPVAPLTSSGSLGTLLPPPGYCFQGVGANPNISIYGESSATPAAFLQYGAWGGSLAYTCSNANAPHDGLSGAYLGLGIDEYGNFLNGWQNTQGTGWSASGDNTATGGGYKPSRIGLRGAGNISWQALTNAYGIPYATGDTTHPYYSSASCTTGQFDPTLGTCEICPTGYTYNGGGNCAVVAATNCPTPPSGNFYTFNPNIVASPNQCAACPTGSTYNPTIDSSDLYGSCTTNDTSTTSGTVLQTANPCSSGGTYDAVMGQCVSCPTGTLNGQTTASPYCAVTPTPSAPATGACASGTYDGALTRRASARPARVARSPADHLGPLLHGRIEYRDPHLRHGQL